MSPAPAHDVPVEILPIDIGAMGHVDNARYLVWVQAAVVDHWRCFAPPEAVDHYVWVALQHEITFRRPVFLNDRIVASVVLDRVRRESAYYRTFIRRDADVVAQVNSRWCCLDAKTRRPARLDDGIVDRFFHRGAAPAGAAPPSLPAPASPHGEPAFG
ncbi:MAG: hypothetical protein EOP89_16320, partial [Lysobacteraceae bacterium]